MSSLSSSSSSRKQTSLDLSSSSFSISSCQRRGMRLMLVSSAVVASLRPNLRRARVGACEGSAATRGRGPQHWQGELVASALGQGGDEDRQRHERRLVAARAALDVEQLAHRVEHCARVKEDGPKGTEAPAAAFVRAGYPSQPRWAHRLAAPTRGACRWSPQRARRPVGRRPCSSGRGGRQTGRGSCHERQRAAAPSRAPAPIASSGCLACADRAGR